MANVVEIRVTAHDSASRVLGGVGSAFGNLRERATEAIKTLATFAVRLGTVASTASSAAPLLGPAVSAVAGVGKAAINASPALLAFGVAGGIVLATLKAIFAQGSAMRTALSPLSKAFKDAGNAASEAAAKGIRPLAQEFVRTNFPAIRGMMTQVGEAVNQVATGFLKWANSAPGVAAIKGIVDPIGKSMKELAPHVERLLISFTSMLGRIMGVSLAAGSSGLAGVLDKVSEKLDKITKSSVGGGLAKLESTVKSIVNALQKLHEWLSKAIGLYETYQTKFKALADAFAVAGILFGGPVTAVIAAIGLIIRHFDLLKKAYKEVKDYFNSPIGKGVLNDLKEAGEKILPHLVDAAKKIARDVTPALKDLGHTIAQDLVPAIADFAKKAAPVIDWLIDKVGPVLGQMLKGTIESIDGLARALSGLLRVLSGLMSGNFGEVWDGIKKMFSGAGKAIEGLLRTTFAPVIPVFKEIGGALVSAWNGVMGALGSAWDAVVSAIGSVIDAVKKLIEWIGKVVGKTVDVGVSGVEGAINAVQSLIGWIGKIAGKTVNIAESGAEAAAGAVKDLIGWIGKLAGKTVQIAQAGAEAAAGAVNSLINTIKSLIGKAVSVGASIFGLDAVKDLVNWIGKVASKTVHVGAILSGIPGFAHGGVIGAAGGGPRSNMTLVGEAGRELVRLPAGSQVIPHGQTEAMMGQQAGTGPLSLEISGGDSEFERFMVRFIQKFVRVHGGGSVQSAFGRA